MRLQPGVLAVVAFDVLDDRVVRAAVQFQGQLVLGPVAVDLQRPEVDVALAARDLRVSCQPAVEGALEAGLAPWMREVLVAGLPDLVRAWAAGIALDGRSEVGDIEPVAAHRGLDQRVELLSGAAGGSHLDQQSRDRADAQPAAGPDLGRVRWCETRRTRRPGRFGVELATTLTAMLATLAGSGPTPSRPSFPGARHAPECQ